MSSTREQDDGRQHQPDQTETKNSIIEPSLAQSNGNHSIDTTQICVKTSQLKRNRSRANQDEKSLKKRQLIHHLSLLVHNDDEVDETTDVDDDHDQESSLNIGANSTTNTVELKRTESQRRAAHIAAEQKRRNAIRKGYESLQSLVPHTNLLDSVSSQKISKAAILQRSIDYLVQLNKEKEQLKNQVIQKKQESFCLHTLQKTYKDILEMNRNAEQHRRAYIDDEQKFQAFQNIMDQIFVSFDRVMQAERISSLAQFTSAILRWVEDSCRPSDINQVFAQMTRTTPTE